MSTSHYASRPATDKVLSAWLYNPDNPTNLLRKRRLYAKMWMASAVVIGLFDVLAVRFFANDALEALILGALTLPTALFILLCAIEARK